MDKQPISQVFNMDCLEYMRTVPDKYFELSLVDPPYGIDVANLAYTQKQGRIVTDKRNGKIRKNTVNKLGYKHGDWDKNVPPAEYFIELFRISKNQIIWGIEYFDLPTIGEGRIKWNKLVPEGMSFKKYEMAYCSIIDDIYEFDLLWAGMQQAKSFLEPTIHQANKQLNEKRIHPCHKPIMMYKHIISKFAKEGDKILDTHLGSGSSRIACYDGGFDFVGFELDKDYFDASVKRFENYKAQLKLF